jgi:hypothetical protein
MVVESAPRQRHMAACLGFSLSGDAIVEADRAIETFLRNMIISIWSAKLV